MEWFYYYIAYFLPIPYVIATLVYLWIIHKWYSIDKA